MADENNIQLDLEISQGSIDKNFGAIDKAATKSAEASAEVFRLEFEKQTQQLQDAISKIVGDSKNVAQKSAQESARAFQEFFDKQDSIYKASVKQNIDQAISQLTGSGLAKKSAAESASVFQAQFDAQEKEAKAAADRAAAAAAESSKSLFQKIREPVSKAVEGFANIAGAVYVFKEALHLAEKAVEAVFDTILEGEAKIKLEKRFEALAEQAGLAGGAIKDKLSGAVQGLVDDDQQLELASKAFITLGKNAAKLPDIFELARKTYKVFGGDIVQNAEAITQAVETGNKRQLKGIGLYVDLDKAVKNYAEKLGTVPELLTEQQLQQARLNAILETGSGRFKNVSNDTDTVAASYKQFQVASKELFDVIKVGIAEAFGPAVKASIQEVTELINNFLPKSTGDKLGEQSRKLFELRQQYEELQTALEKSKTETDTGIFSAFSPDKTKLIQASMDVLTKDIEKQEKAVEGLREKYKEQNTVIKDTANLNRELSAEEIKRQKALKDKTQELLTNQGQAEAQIYQERFNRQKSLENFNNLSIIREQDARLKEIQEVAAFEKFYKENGIRDEELKEQAINAIHQKYKDQRIVIAEQEAAERKNLLTEAQVDLQNQAKNQSDFLAGVFTQIAANVGSVQNSVKELGKQFVNTFQKEGTKAIIAFAQGTKNGADALQDLFNSMLNAMAEMLINQGLGFILQGAALTLVEAPNGGPLISAGAAMVAFGAGLAAISGANGGATTASGGGSAGGSAGGAETGNPLTSNQPPPDAIAQTPQTILNVNVGGNILNTKESALHIAEVIQDQFGAQGLQIKGA